MSTGPLSLGFSLGSPDVKIGVCAVGAREGERSEAGYLIFWNSSEKIPSLIMTLLTRDAVLFFPSVWLGNTASRFANVNSLYVVFQEWFEYLIVMNLIYSGVKLTASSLH